MKVEFLVWLAAEGGGGDGMKGSSNFSLSSRTHPTDRGVIKAFLKDAKCHFCHEVDFGIASK